MGHALKRAVWVPLPGGGFHWIEPPWVVEFEGAKVAAEAKRTKGEKSGGGWCWSTPPKIEFEGAGMPKLSPEQCKAGLLQIVSSILSSGAGSAEIKWGPGGIRGAASIPGLKLQFETWD